MFKPQVTVSFSEDNVEIAEQLVFHLKKKGIKCYYYKHENQLGKDLAKIIRHYYYTHVRNALVISSPSYVQRRWCRIELDYILKAKHQKRLRSLFIVMVDEQSLPHVDKNVIHAPWQNNPEQLAKSISEQVKETIFELNRYILVFLFLILVGLLWYVYLVTAW
jgi:hypothetical protein